MRCTVNIGSASAKYHIPQTYVFDVIQKLGTPHLAALLLDYEPGRLLQLDDYIEIENGQKYLNGLRQHLLDTPSLTRADLGGNRILVEYYRGTLIISDDLVVYATNVVDL
jgi:hypothetical protein